MPSHYTKYDAVALLPLSEYDRDGARSTLNSLMNSIGAFDLIKHGMTVVIKANLVSAMKPSEAATTHPVLLCALCDILRERGVRVIVGDSPGGLYTPAFVNRVYQLSRVCEVEAHGGELNTDFSVSDATHQNGRVLHSFTYTSYLDKADVIINFAKLKSHGMMNMSGAAKNMFGAIPGITKPEYHYRFPNHSDFAKMLLDLDDFFHPEISIIDAVVGMEGNGPTAGTPRPIGCVMASRSPHTLDMAASHILGFLPEEIPTLAQAQAEGLIPDSVDELNLTGNLSDFVLADFERVVERREIRFSEGKRNPLSRLTASVTKAVLATRPTLKADLCVGCGVCKNICPAKAIVIKNKRAKINRRECIRCFCCQEFCPKSALKVKRTFIARLVQRS